MFTPLNHQQSFSSIELSSLSKSRTAKFLDEVNKLINWKEIEDILQSLYCHNNGRPAFSPITLIRGLLLEQWYRLSDRALEEELKDRLSFRNFVGLKSDQDSPDETTFVRFRQKLQERHLEEQLFNLIRDQLRKDDLEVKEGKCVLTDASIIESPYGKESKGKDGNGDFIQRKNKVIKGYKTHVVANQKDNLIETATLTVASCHESRFLEQTLAQVNGKINSVIADKGYASKQRKREFKQKNIYCGILEKREKGQFKLSRKQKIKNQRLIKIRAKVERIFAVVKKHYRWNRVRYFGLRNNTSHMWYLYTAYNLQLVALKTINSS